MSPPRSVSMTSAPRVRRVKAVCQQVLGAGPAAEGVDRWVLEEGEGFFAAGADGVGGRLLPAQGGGVCRDGPAMEADDVGHGSGRVARGDPSP